MTAPAKIADFFEQLWSWWSESSGDIDRNDLKHLLEGCGLVQTVPYDRKRHRNMDGAENGDTVLELRPGIQAVVDSVRATRRKAA